MEWSVHSANNPLIVSVLAGLVLLRLLLLILVKARNGSSGKRPPGPPRWPIFGNMFHLGELPHQTMHKLKSTYGPILWLQLGSRGTMVIQNAASATELFKKHDVTFSDRKAPHTLTALDFDKGSLAMNNYGGNWRVLRRLCSMELMSHRRMSETTDHRRRILDNMIQWIEEDSIASCAQGGTGAVQLRRFLFLMAFNMIGNLMLSRDLFDATNPEGREFLNSLNEIVELAARPNIADFLPFLKWMDPLGLKRRMIENMTKTMRISSKFVQERLRKRKAGEFQKKKDFLDTLLDYKRDGKDGPDSFTEKHVNILIMEMFMAGTDTSVVSIEWCFAELLRNPHAFAKVKEEIDQVVGLNRKVEESDIENLKYLQAVVKESFRLHPPIPLLFPRNAMEDTNYMEYLIPKGTQVFVNVWAIGRDPNSWENPMTFEPERFLNSNIEHKGQHFELIPFGSGRRICVGFPLAHRVVHLVLATLVQAFDWDPGSNVKPEDIDMDETFGIVLKKKNSLNVIPKKRLRKKK